MSLCKKDIRQISTITPMFSGSDNTTVIVQLLCDFRVTGKSQMAALTGNRFEIAKSIKMQYLFLKRNNIRKKDSEAGFGYVWASNRFDNNVYLR